MKTYDNIVIGAGSSGCVVASRLSEDPDRNVLLIEAGGSNRRLDVRAPAAFAEQFHSKVDWDYWTEPEPGLDHRKVYSPRGKMLGGCSSTNAMLYIRGNRIDYDEWETGGATGWSYEEVLPFFKRSENNQQFGNDFHGQGGPQDVTRIAHVDPASAALAEAATSTGLERNDDFNGERQDGVGQPQVCQRNGMRWSAAEAFLRPARRRRNLTVMTRAQATRIIIENGRAAGVELKTRRGLERVDCSGEIVLSGGAFNTPALLQHSGIGPAAHLRSVGIEPLVDLPAVGENLMEHPITYCTFELKPGYEGLVGADSPKELANWLLRRPSKLASNVAEMVAHVQTDPAMPAPNFQFLFAPAYFFEHGLQSWDEPAATIALSMWTPESRGHVRVRSADPLRKPAVQLNMLTMESEMDQMIDAVGLAREIAEAGPAREVLTGEISPGPSLQSRDEIAAWVRGTAQHTYHPACSARIGDETAGAVDPQLRVHGIEGLRIADASVMPTITRGNTHAPSLMIGERCAEFIRTSGSSAELGTEAEIEATATNGQAPNRTPREANRG